MEEERKIIYKKVYKELHATYPDFVWKPQYLPLLNIASKVIKRFPVEVVFENNLPTDGVMIIIQNHSNFYDSLVFDEIYNGINYFCLASDEPRGKITGLSFEGKGIVWHRRGKTPEESKKNGEKTLKTQIGLLKSGLNSSWCPEGTWNLSDNALMLNIAYGMSKAAIEVSKIRKTYIVPTIIEYDYNYETAKISKATSTVCEAIEITPEMDYIEVTERITELYWTRRWIHLEEKAEKDINNTFKIDRPGFNYVYIREEVNPKQWEEFI